MYTCKEQTDTNECCKIHFSFRSRIIFRRVHKNIDMISIWCKDKTYKWIKWRTFLFFITLQFTARQVKNTCFADTVLASLVHLEPLYNAVGESLSLQYHHGSGFVTFASFGDRAGDVCRYVYYFATTSWIRRVLYPLVSYRETITFSNPYVTCQFFHRKHKNASTIYIIPPGWHDTGSWNPSYLRQGPNEFT